MSNVEPTIAGGRAGARKASGQAASPDTESTPLLDLASGEPIITVNGQTSPTTGSAARSTGLRRRQVFGLSFVDAPSLAPVVDMLLHRPPLDNPDHQDDTVLTPNVDIMVQLTVPGANRTIDWRMYQRSRYCLPDGRPIVAASKILGAPLQARLTGSELFAVLWPRLVAGRRATMVVASSDQIAERLQSEYPDGRFLVAPMFDADDRSTVDQMAKHVIESADGGQLEYLLLGIGHPKDARISAAVLAHWNDDLGRPPTILGLGAASSMYVGIIKRAPQWVQRIGMEWFHRFLQEPRRLFRRYFVRDVAFFPLVWRLWRSGRTTRVEIEE